MALPDKPAFDFGPIYQNLKSRNLYKARGWVFDAEQDVWKVKYKRMDSSWRPNGVEYTRSVPHFNDRFVKTNGERDV